MDPHGGHDHEHQRQHGHGAPGEGGVSLNRLAFQATVHCLTGCAIGEVLGMVIGTAYGLATASTIVVRVASP